MSRYIPELTWHLIVEQNNGMMVREIKARLYQTGFIIAAIIITVLLVITTVLRNFNRQITQLIEERQDAFKRATEQLYDNIYELNITKNRSANKLTEQYFESLGAGNLPYDQGLKVIAEKQIKEEYRAGYIAAFTPQNVIREYEKGNSHLRYDFMITQDGNGYFWMRIDAYIFFSQEDGCLHMFTYRKNIESEKEKEILASIDEMTGFLTKTETERKIAALLSAKTDGIYAFFLFDIDNFKQVNDNFGHLYGDAFLCEISRKIKSKFRNDDLVARLGGDEYLVLMKNISNSELAIDKANDLCKLIEGAYGTGGTKVKVTVSVGVVFYPNHGKTFDELYHHGDQALYKIKKNNKNGVCLYDESLEISDGQLDKVNNIVDRATKKFSDNVGEYIFRILYKCQDLNETITAVLELLGMHYYMSQNLIIVRDLDIGKYKVNNYWSSKNEDLTKVIDVTYHDYWPEYVRQFDDEGILWVNDIKASDVSPAIKTLYANSKTRMVISGLIKNGDDIIGIISMEHEKPYAYKAEEKEMLLTSIAIISTFLVKKYQEKEKNQYLNAIQMILDFQENGIYVIDPNTYKLVYYNHKIKHIFNQVKVGDYCYKSFRGYDEPCADCPIKDMKDSDLSYTKLIYNCNISAQLETTVKRVRWINGQDVAAVTSIDITKYYNEK